MSEKKWEVMNECKSGDIIEALLANRGLKTKKAREEFFEPVLPTRLSGEDFGIRKRELEKAVERIKRAKRKGEKVIVYGDYDADGICGTAVMWECLDTLGIEALPYIPERISEGYGLSVDSVEKLKSQNPNLGLVVTVDNGVVAHEALEGVAKFGMDVIVTDHHQPDKKLPKAVAVVHTTKTSGSAVAWVLARELGVGGGLELVAVGTVADQLPLIGVNRSLVKYGLEEINKTERLGLLAMFEQAGAERGEMGVYEINYVIAPRINAMGRLAHGMDSLRLLCTRSGERAERLAKELNRMNQERQRIVEEAYLDAEERVSEKEGVIVVSHEEYHEGVIGLVASGLVEKYYRPAIVFSKGEKYAKASGRSVMGFNMIEMIRKLDEFLVEGGGHPMAAGFTIETSKMEVFSERLQELAEPLLTEEVLERKLRIDLEIDFNQLNWQLLEEIEKFEPTGIGNPKPVFCVRGVEVVEAKMVGREGKHLKLRLAQDGREYDGIGFGLGKMSGALQSNEVVDVAFNLERNVWNGRESMQLKVKDIRKVK